MGCGGDREEGKVLEEQKWDYITLSDFKSTSCWEGFSYGWLWFMAIVSIAVYGADTFTAVNLLVFNKWSSQIQPAIKFDVSKWIFAVCIILSWALCAYERFRAIRVIRRGGVAESFLDPLAVTLQSIRMGTNGRGWRRFLVFSELTKSRKGADYVALFTYFEFKGAIRIIFAEGPRQAVNAMTLYAVMQADLVPVGKHAATQGHTAVVQFFVNVGILADTNKEQAVILFTMLFTLTVWVFSALCLIVAALCYITFLWHYIPSSDGRLSVYCRRKVDSRLEKIVNVKVKRALERQDAKRRREEQRALKNGEGIVPLSKKPTLPVLPNDDMLPEFALLRKDAGTTFASYNSSNDSLDNQPAPHSFVDSKDAMLPRMVRQDSYATLPPYSAQAPIHNAVERLGLHREPTLPNVDHMDRRPIMPSRSGTSSSGFSAGSYSSDAPLLNETSGMGYSKPMPMRSMTGSSSGSQQSFLPPSGQSSGFSVLEGRGPLSPSALTARQDRYGRPIGPPLRQSTQDSFTRTVDPPTRTNTGYSSMEGRNSPAPSAAGVSLPPSRTNTAFSSVSRPSPNPLPASSAAASLSGRHTPGPSGLAYEMTPHSPLPPQPTAGSYVAFDPARHSQYVEARARSTTPVPPLPMPRRDLSTPLPRPPRAEYFRQIVPQRSATAPLPPHITSTLAYEESVAAGQGQWETMPMPQPP
ncbi:Potassium transporter, partial [Cryomyces antarcticus]